MSEDEKYGFLNDEAPEVEVQETAPETVIPETVEATPPATAAVVPTTTEPEGTHVPLAALKAEREKRQAFEKELAQLRAQAAQAPPEIPAFYEAPEQHIQAVLSQAQQQVEARMYAAFEADAREAFPDYDEVLAELTQAAETNPLIRQQVASSANPAKAAYKLGKQLRDLKAAQDPVALRASIEAEVRASIKAEQEAAEKAKAAAANAIPPDISAARSTREETPVEDDSLDSILASRRKR